MPATRPNTITPRRAIKNNQVRALINLGYVALGRSPTASTATARPTRRATKWSATSPISRHGKVTVLATVIDCHTKKVVGYAMDDNYKTPLIVEAVRMAARNVMFADGAIFHSDRGSNYTSNRFSRPSRNTGSGNRRSNRHMLR